MAKYFGKAPAEKDTVVLLWKGRAYEKEGLFESKGAALKSGGEDILVADLGKRAGVLRYASFKKKVQFLKE